MKQFTQYITLSMEHNIKHLAVIMDGNRRWATQRGLPKLVGHSEGAKAFKKLVEAANERGIEYLTTWGLSTENLQRSEEELKHLFDLMSKITDYLGDFKKNNVRFNTIGDMSRIPQNVQNKFSELKEETKNHTGLTLNLAIAYGGRDEIVRATKKIIEAGLTSKEVTETTFENYLDTAGMPEVDMVIRTGGHQRLSGYLAWQTTYAELYYTDLMFPDFSPEELDKAIQWFTEQERKRGK